MVNEELLNNIKARFQQGEHASEIKEALMNEGWSEGDISAAFAQIRHEAFLQIPIYAKIHNWMNSVDKKTAELPPKTIVQIFIGIFLLFIGMVAAMYYFLDPMGLRMAERDKQREENAVELRLALEKYYKENKAYPAAINQLVPKYLSTVLVDPQSKKTYDYKILQNGLHYEFCLDFEIQVVRCITSDNSSSIPTESEEQQSVTPANVQYAINGQIYYDVDKNGERDDTDEFPSQIPVKITDATSTVVCDTKTDSSGIFNCNVSGEGQYIVTVTVPPGYASDLGNPIQVTLPGTSSQVPNVETLFVGLVK